MFKNTPAFKQNLCKWNISFFSRTYRNFCPENNCGKVKCDFSSPSTAPTTAPTIAPRKKKAFLSRDELKAAVDEYCEEPNGWVSNSKYSDYG